MFVLAAACSDGGGSSSGTSTTSPSTTTSVATTTTTALATDPAPENVAVELEEMATVEAPTDLVARPGDDDALFVAERAGRIRVIRGAEVDAEPVLDLSDEVSTDGEQGLLGLTFSPDGQHLYVHWTDLDGASQVTEYRMDGDRADTASRRDLLTVEQPSPVHNGGGIAFGPDGLLYISLGEGDNEQGAGDRAQRLDTLLGKILRIDPEPDRDRPYTVPPDNPFVDDPDARPEIWALGLRNPWRFSFDGPTGDLWIADVGQFIWEEINWLTPENQAGANLGWARLEGSHPFQGRPAPDDHTLPIHEYDHDQGGCAVTGGYVYRGQAIPDLRGAYVFGDFCRSRLLALTHDSGDDAQVFDIGESVPQLASFGVGRDGELYLLSLAGTVHRMVPAPT